MPDHCPMPASPSRSRQHATPPRRGRAPQTAILVVDDEEAVRETIEETLGIYSYRVVTAASVEEAETVKQQLGVEGIGLVITDVHLTPSSEARAGYALAQRWRVQHPGISFILMSGDASTQELPEVRAGTLRFLLKPFQIDAFLEMVRDAIGR